MPDIWLPESARRLDPEMERIIAESEDPALMRRLALELLEEGVQFAELARLGASIASPDSAVILFPTSWGRITTGHQRVLNAAFVKSDELRRSILDGGAVADTTGIIDKAPESPMIQALCPAFLVRLTGYQLIVPINHEGCAWPGSDWTQDFRPGFAIGVLRTDGTGEDENGRVAYIASDELHAMGPDFILPARQAKTGRNDRCPCGSGLKFKRCCGS